MGIEERPAVEVLISAMHQENLVGIIGFFGR